MQNIKVSIIIPVYNTADYLNRCLDSCVNQTLKEIEVIVVNDCSPDPRDGEIMREYEKNFPNKVRCIWHKENLRQGGARNTGIRAACGEFLYFADSDDYLDLKSCEKMYNAIIAENADMATCDCNYVDDKIVIENWSYSGRINGKFESSDLCSRIKDINMNTIWLIMIRKSVIQNNNLYFPEHTISDDYVSVLWFLASPKIVRLNEALYYYVKRQNSISLSYNMQSHVLIIKTFEYILSSDYFNSLDIPAKKMVFIYLFKNVINHCYAVCIKYPAEFVNFCNSILALFKIYKVNYDDNVYAQQENGIWVRDILCFIELNIGLPDLYFEFLAFWNTYYTKQQIQQDKVMQLKKLRSCIFSYIGKRLTLWGCGYFGKQNAENMSIMGIKFEITDTNAKNHGESIANSVVKPWDELKDCTDVVLVSAKGIFYEVNARLSKECPDIKVVDLMEIDDLYGRIPHSVRIEASTLCQLNCKTCYMRKSDSGVVGKGYLKYDDFKKFILAHKFITKIELSNSGEIFLNPDLVDILKCAFENKVELTANNGVNFNTASAEIIEALVVYNFISMTISIDGASQEVYSKYRINGNFDNVINNIKKLNHFKNKYNSEYPKLIWQYIIMEHNENDVSKAKEMAKELGMEFYYKLTWDSDYTPKNVDMLKKETGLQYLARKEMLKDGKIAYHLCYQLWESPQINYDGRLLGCCNVYLDDFGANVFEIGLEKAINSANYITAKKMLKGEIDIPKDIKNIPCINCPTFITMKKEGIFIHSRV